MISAEQRAAVLAGLPRRVVAAGALITDESGRVLLVEPTYKPGWEIPGGVVEAGESPRQAVRRECTEELGVDLAVGPLLVIEHGIAPSERGDAALFVYDGGRLPAATVFRLPERELRSYAWTPVPDLPGRLPAGLLPRVRAALRARDDGCTIELVDGRPDDPAVAPGADEPARVRLPVRRRSHGRDAT